jgi:predicted neutral ceramidase superfamily lipid hydrolase
VRESYGLSEVEVLTTDTHEGAGVAGASYEILNDARVSEEIVSLLEDAISRVERASASYGVATIETVAFGERGIRLLAAAADAGFRAAKLGACIITLALGALALIMALA